MHGGGDGAKRRKYRAMTMAEVILAMGVARRRKVGRVDNRTSHHRGSTSGEDGGYEGYEGYAGYEGYEDMGGGLAAVRGRIVDDEDREEKEAWEEGWEEGGGELATTPLPLHL